MPVSVRIPTPLRTLAGGKALVEAEGGTVTELFRNLDARYPGLQERLCDEHGLRRFINVYVNGEDIRFLDGEGTALREGDQISIIPAIAGGGEGA
jgi:molybdopterin synthase sulfur carrier subunit